MFRPSFTVDDAFLDWSFFGIKKLIGDVLKCRKSIVFKIRKIVSCLVVIGIHFGPASDICCNLSKKESKRGARKHE
ncbi:hypothetical protein D3C71_1648680 [compost metagenome]